MAARESGALLRCWEPFEGTTRWASDRIRTNRGAPAMHHYVGAAGAERLVSLAYADHDDVRSFRGERGAEVMWQRRSSLGYYSHIDIRGWWCFGFWHSNLNSPAWKLMMATRLCATCAAGEQSLVGFGGAGLQV